MLRTKATVQSVTKHLGKGLCGQLSHKSAPKVTNSSGTSKVPMAILSRISYLTNFRSEVKACC